MNPVRHRAVGCNREQSLALHVAHPQCPVQGDTQRGGNFEVPEIEEDLRIPTAITTVQRPDLLPSNVGHKEPLLTPPIFEREGVAQRVGYELEPWCLRVRLHNPKSAARALSRE